MNFLEQIQFNKDCIALYYSELKSCDESQKKPIWAKIIGFLQQNIEYYSELEKIRKSKLQKRRKKQPLVISKPIETIPAHPEPRKAEREDFDYDYQLPYMGAEKNNY